MVEYVGGCSLLSKFVGLNPFAGMDGCIRLELAAVNFVLISPHTTKKINRNAPNRTSESNQTLRPALCIFKTFRFVSTQFIIF